MFALVAVLSRPGPVRDGFGGGDALPPLSALEIDYLVLPTSGVTTQLASADDVIAELLAEPVGAGVVRTLAPTSRRPLHVVGEPRRAPGSKGAGASVDPESPAPLHRPRDEATEPANVQSLRPKRQLDSHDAPSPASYSMTSSTAPDGRTASSYSTTTSDGSPSG